MKFHSFGSNVTKLEFELRVLLVGCLESMSLLDLISGVNVVVSNW